MMEQYQGDNERAQIVETRIASAGREKRIGLASMRARHGPKLGIKRGGWCRHEDCFRVARAKIVANSFACSLMSRLGSRASKGGTASMAWRMVSAITRVLKRRNSPDR